MQADFPREGRLLATSSIPLSSLLYSGRQLD